MFLKILDDSTNDKVWEICKINQNISKIKNTSDSDNKFLEEIGKIVLTYKNGYLNKRNNKWKL